MRVAILSKSDSLGGGAGLMAENLALWLRQDGHEAVHFARWGGAAFSSTFRPAFGRWVHLAKRVEARTLMNETLPLELGAVLYRIRQFRPDVVHFHDLTTAYNVMTVDAVARRFPTVWTLHDQSPMTGGCITPHPCERFRTGCGDCPKFPKWPLNGRIDMTARVQRQKRAFFLGGRGVLTTPSRAAASRLADSGVLDGRDHVAVVPNGIDLRSVRAIDPRQAREWLGLPAERFIVVLIAHDLDDPLKNPRSQREALRAISDLDPYVVVVGNTSGNPGSAYSPNEVRHMGFVASAPLKNAILSAADIFLNTSLGDTFSMTTLESLAAGTPVVAYASGGIPEVILDQKTGALVPPDDATALAGTLREIIVSGCADQWRALARDRAGAFGHERIRAEFIDVYRRAIDGFTA
jgi:glycosyltransferase involved in cell wall biosynthesis